MDMFMEMKYFIILMDAGKLVGTNDLEAEQILQRFFPFMEWLLFKHKLQYKANTPTINGYKYPYRQKL